MNPLTGKQMPEESVIVTSRWAIGTAPSTDPSGITRRKSVVKGSLEGRIHIRQCHRQPQIDKGCHPIFGDAARYDARKMIKIRFDIDRNSMKTDPFPQA